MGNIVSPDSFQLPSADTLTDKDRCKLKQWLEETCRGSECNFAVYVLNCTPPPEGEWDSSLKNQIETARELIRTQARDLKKEHYVKRDAADAERVYYVGRAGDVIDRIERHLGGPGKRGGSWFTYLFRPKYLEEVHWYKTETESVKGERKVADKIDRRSVENYVYWH